MEDLPCSMEESNTGLNRLPLLAEALIPGTINNFHLSPMIRSSLRDFLQQDLQIHKSTDKKLEEEYVVDSDEVRLAERELMVLHAEILARRRDVENALPKRDIPRRLVEQFNLIPFKSTFQDSINKRALQTGIKINHSGTLSLVEYPDPDYNKSLASKKLLDKKRISQIWDWKNQEISHQRAKIQRKIEFAVTPKEIIFKTFEIGKSYHVQLKVQNISRSSGVFRLIIPKNKCFTISSGGKMKELAPGLSAFFRISFSCQDKDDHEDNIKILVEGGDTIIVPMKAIQESPFLRTNDAILLMAKTSSFHRIQTSANFIDCERCHVGDTKRLTLPVLNEGPLARFFIISELSWIYKNLVDVTEDSVVISPPFSLKPAYLTLKRNESTNLEILFRPTCEGSHAAKFYVACDNITVRTIDLVGESIAFRPDFFTFENLNKVYNVMIEDDIDAQYCLYLGKCFQYGTVRSFLKIESSSITEMRFCWKMAKANITGINSIPSKNISLSPDCGLFCQSSKITFTITFQGHGLPVGRHASLFTIYIEDLPLESIPANLGEENYFIGPNGRVSVALARVEVWVDVVEPCVTILENYIVMKAIPNVETKSEVHISNFSSLAVTISWRVHTRDMLFIHVTPEWTMMPALSSKKFYIHFRTFAMGLYTTVLKVFVKDTTTSFDVKIESNVELFVSKGGYSPIDCGIIRVGDKYEGGVGVKVATPISARTEMGEYMLMFDEEDKEQLIKTSGKLVQEYPRAVKPGEHGRIWYKLNTEKFPLVCSIPGEVIKGTDPGALSTEPGPLVKVALLCHSPQHVIYNYKIQSEQICYNIMDWRMWDENFFLEVLGDCQLSCASLEPVKYTFDTPLFLGEEEEFILRVRNHKLMPTKYELKPGFGPDAGLCTLTYSFPSGVIPPDSDQEIKVTLNPMSPGLMQELYIPCYVEGMMYPLVSQILAVVKDVEVKFSWPEEDGALFTVIWPEEEWNTGKQHFPSEEGNTEPTSEITEVSVTSSARMEYDIMHYVDSTASSVPYKKWPIIGGRYYGTTFTDEDLKKEFEEEWTCETLKEKFKKMDHEEIESTFELFSKKALCFEINAFNEETKSIEITNLSPIRSLYKTKAGFFRTRKTPPLLKPFTEAEIYFHHGKHSDAVSPELTKRLWMDNIRDNVGLGVTTKRKKGFIKGYETIGVKITVFGVAWGTYFDTVTIEIANLPPFHIPIMVSVTENPVYFTFAPNVINPVLRFSSTVPENIKRKQVFLKNNSFLPLWISWTTFVIPQDDHRTAHLSLPKTISPNISVLLDLEPKSETDFCKIHLTEYLGKQESIMYRVTPPVVKLPPQGKVPLEIISDTTRCWYDKEHTVFILHGTAVGVIYVDDDARMSCNEYGKYANEDVACYRPEGFEIDQIYLNLETKVEISSIRIINSSFDDCVFRVKTTDIFSCPKKSYSEKRKYIIKNFGDGKAQFSIGVAKPFAISSVYNKSTELPVGKEYCLECKDAIEVEVMLTLTADFIFQMCEAGCTYLHNKGSLQSNLICKQRDYSEHVFALHLEILKPLIQISQNELDFGPVALHSSETRSISVVSFNGNEPFTVKYRVEPDENIFKLSHHTGVFEENEKFLIAVTFTPRECTRYHVIIEFVTTTPGYVVPFIAIGTGRIDQRRDI